MMSVSYLLGFKILYLLNKVFSFECINIILKNLIRLIFLIEGIRTIDTGETKRTFIFIDFITSDHAKIAKEVLEKKADRMFPNHRIVVAWAHSSRYNTLHVRNFSSQMTQEKLAELFEPYGEIIQIKMNKDHAYLLFKSVFDAALARDELNSKVTKVTSHSQLKQET